MMKSFLTYFLHVITSDFYFTLHNFQKERLILETSLPFSHDNWLLKHWKSLFESIKHNKYFENNWLFKKVLGVWYFIIKNSVISGETIYFVRRKKNCKASFMFKNDPKYPKVPFWGLRFTQSQIQFFQGQGTSRRLR